MTLEEMKNHKWSVSWSGGKDSTATIILMHENNVPIEEIVYIRMMYDEVLPATLPAMTEFVDRSVNVFKAWGYKVKIVKSVKSAVEVANQCYKKSVYENMNGKPYGITQFFRGRCKFQGVKAKTLDSIKLSEYQMIGYAADETDRIQRLTETQQSIMVTLGINEKDAFDICRKYNLLSPLYDFEIGRDGCFFCPNCSRLERGKIKREHPELLEKIDYLIELSAKNYDIGEGFPNVWVQDYFDRKLLEKQVTFDDLARDGWID